MPRFEKDGRTLLAHASAGGHLTLVALLLDHYHANINLENNQGYTPLYLACKYGQLAVVQLLLKRGANLNCVSNTRNHRSIEPSGGDTPLHCLLMRMDNDRGVPVAKELLRAGADIFLGNAAGKCVVRKALERKRTSLEIKDYEPSIAAAYRMFEAGPVSDIVLQAARPWSLKTHELFPRQTRQHVFALLCIGEQLARRYPTLTKELWQNVMSAGAVQRNRVGLMS